MTGESGMLVVADGAQRERLDQCLGSIPHKVVADAYQALEEMRDRSWRVIVLTAPRADFAGLCRAAHRLAPDARLLGVCPPVGETQARPLAGKVLDDYFIEPLEADDVEAMARLARSAESGAPAPPAPPAPPATAAAAATPARRLAELIDASQDLQEMDSHLVRVVAALVGCPVSWTSPDRVPSGAKPLLMASGKKPRVLVPLGTPRQSPMANEYLRLAQECLPSLVSAAQRTQGLHLLSITDHLTGAYNRRYFYEATERILQRAGQMHFSAVHGLVARAVEDWA